MLNTRATQIVKLSLCRPSKALCAVGGEMPSAGCRCTSPISLSVTAFVWRLLLYVPAATH
jgi:hypothetical protein